MRYVEARIDNYNREEAYRIYIAKCLELSPQGKALTISYSDMLKPQKVDTRSGGEIVTDVMKNAGLSFGE